MEQEHLPESGPNPGMYGSDRDIFSRVWQRVMPGERWDCPIELNEEAGLSPAAAPVPGNAPAFPAACSAEGKSAPEYGASCLSTDSAIHGEQLQGFIVRALENWTCYRTLAGRSGSGPARALYGLAADERRHARRLRTAYFLISGVQYWPDHPPSPFIPSYLGVLRRRFREEQEEAAAYRKAAEETADPCLHDLYLELAEDEYGHAQLIRTVLEQL